MRSSNTDTARKGSVSTLANPNKSKPNPITISQNKIKKKIRLTFALEKNSNRIV